MNFLLSHPCNAEGHVFKVFFFFSFLSFSLGSLMTENFISRHKSSGWNDTRIPAAAHVTRNSDKCTILLPV